ncbi:MAG: hypothetical protein PHI18_03405, partial [bacterium]|nr:hypothetical protein [bacterium]
MYVRGTLFLVMSVLFAAALSALAAEFSPALEAELAAKSGSEFVSAIVFLESPLDIRALDARLHEQR